MEGVLEGKFRNDGERIPSEEETVFDTEEVS
jgi:hypothetical protein